MQPCSGCRLTGSTAALLPEGKKKKSPAVFVTALLLTLLLSDTSQEHGGAISTDLTSCRSPSLLQQLASFAALREVAEEEQLDWGAPLVLGRQKRYSLCVQPSNSEYQHQDQQEKEKERKKEEEEGEELERVSDECTSDSATGSSRRRPHRRQHRRKKSAQQQGCDEHENNHHNKDNVVCQGDQKYEEDGMRSQKTISGCSTSASCGESSAGSLECVETPRGSRFSLTNTPTLSSLTQCLWSQLHVMEIALSTQDNNFLHITQRFVQYEAMYPIVYRTDISRVMAPQEEELLAAPTTGLQSSRFWSCRSCGKAHDVVRESCLRCRRHAGPYTKLFFGQTIKEVNCARSLLRLLYATHPGVVIHRIEAHENEDGRHRGCASVYVSVDAASELISKLNGNVFFDSNRIFPSSSSSNDDNNINMDGLYVDYVYTSQRPWLEALIAARTSQRHHNNTMPWGALVVEESKGKAHSTTTPSIKIKKNIKNNKSL
ncbi:uncharacterized protein TM35_000322070 [Trypanosoma theileri]|uniref:Uncharacterized protein n=1 Tax=Trypanosoma theileri TaxID=67003 RepID=A0A1X0NMC5_9TRYP|nr:uncharacterized protein TM35_000322070 [Trypanosoma theileri]ORC85892.1 hypothetical protein TM35_000322070 [Trypanosoma theileri]